MRKIFTPLIVIVLAFSSCVKDREFPDPATVYVQPGTPSLGTRTPIHYWNFNGASLLTPTTSIGGAALSYAGATYDAVSPGTALNARNGDADGSGLRLRNPAGDFILSLPTVNYKDIIFSFAEQRSNNGPQLNRITYTIDGSNYISDSLQPTLVQPGLDWQCYSLDFSNIKRVNNNPNFKIKIAFSVNSTGTDGNDRFDNITLDGNIINPIPILPELVHYWNFNNNASFTTLITPTVTKGGGALNYTAVWDEVTPGSLLNARNSDVDGSALRLRNPAGIFTITAPTTSYKNIKVSFAVMRTSNGAQTNTLTYTTDGTNYVSTGVTPASYNPSVEPDYMLVTYDLSSITTINNNSNFKIKIEFSNGNTGSSGNNRFDNIAIEGVHL